MIDYEEWINDIQNEIHKIGRKISYKIRTTDFQQGCLVGQAFAYGKILKDLQDKMLKELKKEPKTRKIQPAPCEGNIPKEVIQKAVESVSRAPKPCQHEYKKTLAKSGMYFIDMCHKCGDEQTWQEAYPPTRKCNKCNQIIFSEQCPCELLKEQCQHEYTFLSGFNCIHCGERVKGGKNYR